MKISVIMTSYNYAKTISEAIDSVLNQGYTDWELIVIDDCSTDNSAEIIKKYLDKDSRIKFIRNEKNLGLKNSILRALSETSGEWVAFLESDDLWTDNYLEKKVEIAKKYPGVALIFNYLNLFGDDKKRIFYTEKFFEKNHKKLSQKKYPTNIFNEFITDNVIWTFSCVMIKKTALDLKFFNADVDRLLDWWLYIHLTYKNDVVYIPEKLTNWRFHKGSYTRKSSKKSDFFSNINAYRDILKDDNTQLKLNIKIFKIFLQKFFGKSIQKIQKAALIAHKF